MTPMDPTITESEHGLVEKGFVLFEAVPHAPPGHIHSDIEISVFEHGSVTMLYSGRSVTIRPDHLVIHWGIIPHQMLERDPDARVVGLQLPLVWFLQWELPRPLVSRLLNLEVLIEPSRVTPCSDLVLLRDWMHVIRTGKPEAQEIVLSEVRGRLWRLASEQKVDPAPGGTDNDHVLTPGIFRRAVEFMADHFRDPIHIPDIAEAANVSRTHLMRLFRKTTGWTVNEYMTHLRLCHAQRLLVTTDDKVLDIMFESGFNSPNRFYEVFREQTGLTPARYRRAFLLAKR